MLAKLRRKVRKPSSPQPSRPVSEIDVEEDYFIYIAHYYRVRRAQGSNPWRNEYKGPWKQIRVAGAPADELTLVPRGGACNCDTCLLFFGKHSKPEHFDGDFGEVDGTDAGDEEIAREDVATQNDTNSGDREGATHSSLLQEDSSLHHNHTDSQVDVTGSAGTRSRLVVDTGERPEVDHRSPLQQTRDLHDPKTSNHGAGAAVIAHSLSPLGPFGNRGDDLEAVSPKDTSLSSLIQYSSSTTPLQRLHFKREEDSEKNLDYLRETHFTTGGDRQDSGPTGNEVEEKTSTHGSKSFARHRSRVRTENVGEGLLLLNVAKTRRTLEAELSAALSTRLKDL